MGDMADQYDDGRYDGAAEVSAGRYYPDGILAPPEPNCLIAAGGWHAPLDTVPGLPFGPRGGTLHHHRKDTTTMPKTQKQVELDAAISLRETLNREIDLLTREVQAEQIPAAPSTGSMFAVDVKFAKAGAVYRFLLYRTPKGWYTTGRGEQGFFPNWKALMEWLRGGEIYWHSAIAPLALSSKPTAAPSWRRAD